MKKPEAEWLNVPTDAAACRIINGQHQVDVMTCIG